jgi:hypothetical protein
MQRLPCVTQRLGGYREYTPPPDLVEILEAAWIYERPLNGAPPIAGRGHRIFPEAGVSLCFLTHRDRRGRSSDPDLRLIGPTRAVRFFAPDPGLHLVSVRLKPEWVRDLLKADPADHANCQCSFRGTTADRLLERLARTGDSDQALNVLIDATRSLRGGARLSGSSRIAHAGLEAIRGHRPEPEHPERTLRRAIVETIGVPPKYVQRVQRLHRAVRSADSSPVPDWARLAVETGFYDQAHLIREFRTFTGLSPTELHAERRTQQPAATTV